MLKVYTNEIDWMVAHDLDDLREVYEEEIGFIPDDIDDHKTLDPGEIIKVFWEDEPPEELAFASRVRDEELDEHTFPHFSYVIEARASVWAAWKGRGFLCSTEY